MRTKSSLEERFWAKVDVRSEDECWEWKASKGKWLYGNFRIDSKTFLAHRVAYMLKNGEIPSEMLVCHSCDNPGCCNPKHLWLGTNYDNMQDMFKKGRRPAAKGSRNGSAKLKEEDVLQIRNMRSQGCTCTDISKIYGVSIGTISHIATGRNWKGLER